MKHTILFISFFIILFLTTSCAEQEAEVSLEDFQQQKNNEEPTVQTKESFKQHSVNDNGDYEFTCTEEQQNRVNTFGGNVHTIWSATSEDVITWKKEQYLQPGSVP